MSQDAVPVDIQHHPSPVAIVGMACRLPGAPNLEAYWALLRDGKDGVGHYPAGRTLALDEFYSRLELVDGPKTARLGALPHIKDFDAEFFGISPREAALIDPQQRLLLELTWEALQDAGCPREHIVATKTSVSMGVWSSDYLTFLNEQPGAEVMAQTGAGLYSASGRIAYAFDLQGPEVSLNLGCASGLAAVHHACANLREGSCELAVAGAANIVVHPAITDAFTRAGVLSADGKCKFGDASADGFVRSEGAAVLVLKRLADAMRDGDRVHAVIRGSAVGQNGSSSGSLTTPGQESQAEVIRRAHRASGISAEQVQYVEAHGTGTKVGDPIELAALTDALGLRHGAGRSCVVGSSKSNIGHTEAVSGIAGLIKTVLAIKHRYIPKSLHVEQLNPDVDWATSGLRLAVEGEEWLSPGRPRLAGVNSFGLTGTNVHMVVEEPPFQATVRQSRSSFVLPLTAHSDAALRDLANSWISRLEGVEAPEVFDLCFTAARRSNTLSHRLAVSGPDAAGIAQGLREWGTASATSAAAAEAERPVQPIVFVFPGQGGQWVGMGQQLLQSEAVFRQAIEACSAAIERESGWSLLEHLGSNNEAAAKSISRVQPTLFAVQVALAQLWISWGVTPNLVIGHSMGEIAAAHVAGILTLKDAVAIVCRRSQHLEQISGLGAMAMVELPLVEAASAIDGLEDTISIAVSNGLRATVLSGEPAALDGVIARLTQQGVFCRSLKVDVASHSPQVDPLLSDLRTALEDLHPRPHTIAMYSTVNSAAVDGREMDASYWLQNLRQPVLFHPAVTQSLAQHAGVFVEMSPHPTLVPYIQQTIAEHASDALVVHTLRRDSDEALEMLRGLAKIFERGHDVNWRTIYPEGNVVSLPAYPWQRRTHWIEQSQQAAFPGKAFPAKAARGRKDHPLLSDAIETASGAWVGRAEINLADLPWLRDHVVETSILLPASVFAEMALAFLQQAQPGLRISLTSLSLTDAVSLAEDSPAEMQALLSRELGDRWRLELFVRAAHDAAWTRVATATSAVLVAPLKEAAPFPPRAADRNKRRMADHYAKMAERGYHFGPAFQSITSFALEEHTATARAQLAPDLAAESFGLHPILLDAGLQLLAMLFLEHNAAVRQILPIGIERFTISPSEKPPTAIAITATLPHLGAPNGSVLIFTEEGELLARLEGVSFHPVPVEKTRALAGMMYDVRWKALPSIAETEQQLPSRWIVLESGTNRHRNFSATLRSRDFAVASAATIDEVALALRSDGASRVGVVDLRLLADATGSRETLLVTNCAEIVTLVQLLVGSERDTRLWIVTHDAVAPVSGDPIAMDQAAAGGLAASIANEHPDLQLRCIDLSSSDSPEDSEALAREVLGATREVRVALRNGARFGARLIPAEVSAEAYEKHPASEDQNFQLRQGTAGMLDDFFFAGCDRREPKADEIELRIHASGVNFRNIMEALSLVEERSGTKVIQGIEAAGVITRVGEAVAALRVGDQVMALAGDAAGSGLFARYLTMSAAMVVRKPESLSFAQAASLPAVFLTAQYALRNLANLSAGQTILIHSGTGGVGLAAIQIARALGAQVLATAGSEAKRALLHEMGIHSVFDSRSEEFSGKVLDATGGKGVDVVLNSLSGELLEAGLRCLAPYGRFVEIGKRDMWQDSRLGMKLFLNNRSFFALDLTQMMVDRPDIIAAMMQNLTAQLQSGVIQPMSVQTFPASSATEAFRLMARAGHVGKIVLDFTEPQPLVRSKRSIVSADGTYLITGGAGALGLESAEELISLGARSLVLTTRSTPATRVLSRVESMRTQAVDVHLLQCDLGVEAEVESMLKEVRATMPPLRGVIHAAGVLEDALLTNLEPRHFETVMAGKARGAIYLDRHLSDAPLDFFLLYSSVACILGSPGQGNYSAANAVLDALAMDRTRRGLAATSINWGPWSGVGLAAALEIRGERFAAKGLPSLSPHEGRMLLRHILQQPTRSNIVAAKIDLDGWCKAIPSDAASPFLSELPRFRKAVIPKEETSLVERLRSMASRNDALNAVQTHLVQLAGNVLHLTPEQIPLRKPMRSLGLDSLMGLELRNKLEVLLNLRLSASVIWNYPTIETLAAELFKRLNLPLEAGAEDVAVPAEGQSAAFLALAREIEEAEAVLAKGYA